MPPKTTNTAPELQPPTDVLIVLPPIDVVMIPPPTDVGIIPAGLERDFPSEEQDFPWDDSSLFLTEQEHEEEEEEEDEDLEWELEEFWRRHRT